MQRHSHRPPQDTSLVARADRRCWMLQGPPFGISTAAAIWHQGYHVDYSPVSNQDGSNRVLTSIVKVTSGSVRCCHPRRPQSALLPSTARADGHGQNDQRSRNGCVRECTCEHCLRVCGRKCSPQACVYSQDARAAKTVQCNIIGPLCSLQPTTSAEA